MIQLVLRKLSSPVVLISTFALMLALSLPLQQRLRSIPSISANYGSLENLYNQPVLRLASSQVDLYLDIPRASRITPYLVSVSVDTANISMDYVDYSANGVDPDIGKGLVITVPRPSVVAVPTDSSDEFTIRATDSSVAYRKGLYDFGLIYARRKALRNGLLDSAKAQLERFSHESSPFNTPPIVVNTSSWFSAPPVAIPIPSTRFSLIPYYPDRVNYNTGYNPDKLSHYFITMTDSVTNSTLNMSIYDINSTLDSDPFLMHNVLRTYSGNSTISISLNATGFVGIVRDGLNIYSFVARSPSPSDFTNFLPIALDTLMSLDVDTSIKLSTNRCSDIFYNNIDAWLNADAQSISTYVGGLLDTAYFNPNKTFQTLDIYNTTVIYDNRTLEEYQGNIRQLNTRLQSIGQSSEITSQTANFALYSKNALENNEDIYILFLKTRAYIYVYDDAGNNILNKILNYYQLPSNYKVVINNQSLCSNGRLYEHGDDMFCFVKTDLANFIDKLISNSFVALFKCGL